MTRPDAMKWAQPNVWVTLEGRERVDEVNVVE